uniref:Uncharacterized protein n=1 Tax=Trichinella nativa TaxID=6335 RepID=A0A0V1KIG6_9BILA
MQRLMEGPTCTVFLIIEYALKRAAGPQSCSLIF